MPEKAIRRSDYADGIDRRAGTTTIRRAQQGA